MTDKTYNLNGAPKPLAKRNADLDGADWFKTPAWPTEALLAYEVLSLRVLDPVCGDGAMSLPLIKRDYLVTSSDLYDRGYGKIGIDFFEYKEFDGSIVANPPYNIAEKFIHHALNITKYKVCIFLRLAFLEGITRYSTIYDIIPPSRVYVFSERVTLYSGDNPNAKDEGGNTAYCWMVWDKDDIRRERFTTELCWIAPGFKPRKPRKIREKKSPKAKFPDLLR